MIIAEVYWDKNGHYGGHKGCWRARLQTRPDIHDAGRTAQDAFEQVITTATTHGLSRRLEDYTMVRIQV